MRKAGSTPAERPAAVGGAAGVIKGAGMATRTRFRDRRRWAGKVVRRVSHALSTKGSKGAVEQCTKELRDLSRATLREAAHVVRNATRALRSAARPGAHLVVRLVETIATAERIVAQTTRRTQTASVAALPLKLDARPALGRCGRTQPSTNAIARGRC
jgi:hypothetical protein